MDRTVLRWADSGRSRAGTLDGWTTVATAFGRITRSEPAHDPQPLVTATFRVVVLALAAVMMMLTGSQPWQLAWTIPLALPELVIRGRRLRNRSMVSLGLWWSAVPAVAAPFTGASHSALLACLPVGYFLAGLAAGRKGVLEAIGVTALLFLGAEWAAGDTVASESLRSYLDSSVQWLLFATVVGMVAVRIGRQGPIADAKAVAQHAEARSLLEQLRAVTARMPGSLDVSTTCELLLDGCLRSSGTTVGAVLVHAGGGYHVPVALRGLRRIPWRSPAAEAGPLREAWRTAVPVLDLRPADGGTSDAARPRHERHGSVLLVVPITSDNEVLGLVTLQSSEPERFSASVIDAVQATVARHALQLETAQTFEGVRAAVTVNERSRLARDMHDGVAQDLAYIGFELDLARGAAAAVDPALEQSLTRLRGETTRIISDVRASITDLRSSTSLERGIGAALTTFARNAGATGPMAVHLTLEESAFRLPAEIEIELLRLGHEFITLARHIAGAGNLWVNLTVEPPAARLRLQHDGETLEGSRSLENAALRLKSCGGTLTISTDSKGLGLVADAIIEGGADGDPHRPGR